MKFYLKAAKVGDARGCYQLAALYVRGRGVKQNIARGLGYLQKAIRRGEIRAHHAMGLIYQYGYGIPQNIAKAKEHFLKGMKLGGPFAQIALDKIAHKK
ncbi:tetratricopeptide repeat protein [Helicobacter gastrocanis]|uniref:tetratricopeptide repeat protein n=1 Tax=Helicobacter gastrocanis TaxID=2849641 RepID=UPI001C8496B2|nr:tetratricopeptide repeat protein [Helicobacter sp. NHP19-003]